VTSDKSNLRVLVIGAGIAGATLAALLKQRGQEPVVIEREGANAAAGYMLGLMPLGGRVLHGLGLHERYLQESRPMRFYEIYGTNGRRLKRYPMMPIVERFGDIQGIERGELLNMLRARVGANRIRYCTSAERITQDAGGVEVSFSDGTRERFDVAVIADGFHSHTRGLVFPKRDYAPFRTGWGGWVLWSDAPSVLGDVYREIWNPGWGMGLYPVQTRTGIFLAGPDTELKRTTADVWAGRLRERMGSRGGPFADALDHIVPESDPFYWVLDDGRAKNWTNGRVVLLGDAAAAFLPTAGVGASAAMDSAAALADELSRTDAGHVSHALALHEKRQRHRVEAAQQNSRDLARMMFLKSPLLVQMRNVAMHFYTFKMLLKSIEKVMDSA